MKISQVVTEPEVLQRASDLSKAVEGKALRDFCGAKLQQATDEKEKSTWQFLQVLAMQNTLRECGLDRYLLCIMLTVDVLYIYTCSMVSS